MRESEKRFARDLKRWAESPHQFAHEELKLNLDEWQVEGLKKIGGSPKPRRRIGFKACTGPGKTLELAVIGWLRLLCYGRSGQHPKGAALSGEGRDNLRDNLWSELFKVQQRSEKLKLMFKWGAERISSVHHPETWFLAARSYPKDANAEAIGHSLAGLHSPFPFFLLDEIGRMPPAVGQKASQIFTGGVIDGLIAGAGNPTSVDGLLYHICTTEAAFWDIITITADPNDPKRTPRVDKQHAEEQIKLYGRDNPWVMSTILGLFPPGSINALFSVDEVEKAQKVHLHESLYQFVEKRIGVDVALYGDDRTVMIPRQGLAVFSPEIVIMRTQEPEKISAKLIDLKLATGSDREFIDDTGGWGSGVISHYKLAGYNPVRVQAAGEATDKRFYNKRAEMWFRGREHVRAGGALPNLPEAVAEFTTTEYTMKDGKMLLIPKDMVKKKLLRSPDIADAFMQTFALPDNPRRMHRAVGGPQEGKAITESELF